MRCDEQRNVKLNGLCVWHTSFTQWEADGTYSCEAGRESAVSCQRVCVCVCVCVCGCLLSLVHSFGALEQLTPCRTPRPANHVLIDKPVVAFRLVPIG